MREHSMRWRFNDSEHAVRELAAPVGTESAHRRLRDAMPDLIEVYGVKCGEGLELRSEFALVFALKP